jgi:hypothetical protein
VGEVDGVHPVGGCPAPRQQPGGRENIGAAAQGDDASAQAVGCDDRIDQRLWRGDLDAPGTGRLHDGVRVEEIVQP